MEAIVLEFEMMYKHMSGGVEERNENPQDSGTPRDLPNKYH
jgi:hypothetical protein